MTTWITDEHNNKASIEYWKSEEAARKSLESLKGCNSCTDCSNCTNCYNCYRCLNCSHCNSCYYCAYCVYCNSCTDCVNCYSCHYCTNCCNCSHCKSCTYCFDCIKIKECNTSKIIGPCRSDRYQFVISKSGSIHAGCRVFNNFNEARDHWKKTRGNTPLGNETMFILDFLEKRYNEDK